MDYDARARHMLICSESKEQAKESLERWRQWVDGVKSRVSFVGNFQSLGGKM